MRPIALLAALAVAGCSIIPQGVAARLPFQARPAEAAAPGKPAMVAAANPLAVEAGLQVLRRGGTAADAAVAIQAVLGLVEPQSSGLGGGAFMTYYDGATGEVTAYDGRETAPAGATPDMFLGPDGKPLGVIQAILSGRSTGVPGAVAMLAMVHKEHGRLPWNSLFSEAERLADQGFAVSPRLAMYIVSPFPQAQTPDAKAYFTKPDGAKYKAGDILKNPAYAATVRKIAAEGPKAILEGSIAQDIVARTHAGDLPGTLTLADLKAFKPRKAKALCGSYRVYIVCTNNPPSSGVGLLQGLMLLERTDIASRGPNDPVAWVQLAQVERLMYADRDRYVGDIGAGVPVKGLLDPAYVDSRAKLIGETAGPPPSFGSPPGAGVRGPDKTVEPGGTSHYIIVDQWGNVVSITTTVESVFGSGRMVDGFFLNNQLTDFSFSPTDPDGRPAANAVAPGKRPRSSMTPIIMLDKEGKFFAALGSPGGNSIISYNLKTIVGFVDWKLTMQQAIDLPNMVARGGSIGGDTNLFAPGMVEAMAARGILLGPNRSENSGVHGIVVRPGGVLEGGADPRREGVARAP
ncbi:gamma-glutamyltranspeptidase/glutathione hydrolase [Caulobacter ginsengisoli]|uniref:Glutathione hydrolase proenzyme n=1 Tax=Caulobacter ginsengisoli TaxID=400775 RepID=A0ABU0IXB1_9CAUL|nr:gamma-glutamyltransferase [Caulobacter ginsengisoli]MDQ0466661.1 gamma-glutamyltranspeptidase/glutathione hydrolase [Caulobacter ginsengisoli]